MRKLYLNIVVAIWTVMLLTTVGVAIVANAVLPGNSPIAAALGRAVPADAAEFAVPEAAGTTHAGLAPLAAAGTTPVPTGRIALPVPDGLDILGALRTPSVAWLLAIAIPLSLMLSLAIARYLVQPLHTIEQAGRRLSDGDLTARVGPFLGYRGDEIADFAKAFDRMAERIERLVRAHKDLLRDVSHELRSPLARAFAALSLARQRTDGALAPELDRLETEIERLDNMIGKLLTFSRLDSGERPIAREPVDFTILVIDVVADCRFEARASRKAVDLEAAGDVTVHGDSELLASCLENVIRNAVRHTPTGTAVRVSLVRDESSNRAIVMVRDHGSGVPEEEIQRIFEPFYRFAGSDSSGNGHAGIGLAIAKRAVSCHGGTLAAENAPGGGLLVTIALPMRNGRSPVSHKVAHLMTDT